MGICRHVGATSRVLEQSNRGEGTPRLQRMKVKSQQITVWAQCFALYVSVMAKEYPECVSELMAYMCTIIHTSQEYENSAWVAYDSAYRQQLQLLIIHNGQRSIPHYSLCASQAQPKRPLNAVAAVSQGIMRISALSGARRNLI